MKRSKTYRASAPFLLESGETLPELTIAYHTFGNYVPGKSKVVWVCHALTANSDVSDWWAGLFGKESYFDQPDYFVVCANIIGSCYGTTGPLSYAENSKRYFLEFPLITTRDMAQAHELLRRAIGIDEICLLIGSSLGGQQAQEFSLILGENLQHLVLIATNAVLSSWGIAFNESQRLALLSDPTFGACDYNGGKNGLRAARSIAMLSYRSYEGYSQTQQEKNAGVVDGFKAASYQRYQGVKLANRFNAYSYWSLTKTMDAHHLGRKRGTLESVLQQISAQTLVIGISSDILFPLPEQQFLSRHIPKAELAVIDSVFGHDGFLVETAQLEKLIADFLSNGFKNFRQTTFKTNKSLKPA